MVLDVAILGPLELRVDGYRTVVLSSSTEQTFASQIELTLKIGEKLEGQTDLSKCTMGGQYVAPNGYTGSWTATRFQD